MLRVDLGNLRPRAPNGQLPSPDSPTAQRRRKPRAPRWNFDDKESMMAALRSSLLASTPTVPDSFGWYREEPASSAASSCGPESPVDHQCLEEDDEQDDEVLILDESASREWEGWLDWDKLPQDRLPQQVDAMRIDG